VLSPATARRDRVEKLRTYLRVGVPSYWLVDPVDRTLLVYRRTAEGYLLSLAAGTPIVLRAEPFEAALLPLKSLFGGDDAGNGG
jgi:Uma2 family endonuclease